MLGSLASRDFRPAGHATGSQSDMKSQLARSDSGCGFNAASAVNMARGVRLFSLMSPMVLVISSSRVAIHCKVSRRSQYILRSAAVIAFSRFGGVKRGKAAVALYRRARGRITQSMLFF